MTDDKYLKMLVDVVGSADLDGINGALMRGEVHIEVRAGVRDAMSRMRDIVRVIDEYELTGRLMATFTVDAGPPLHLQAARRYWEIRSAQAASPGGSAFIDPIRDK